MNTVYWAVSNPTNQSPISKALYTEPFKLDNKSVLPKIQFPEKHNNWKLCPAFLDGVENIYGLKFPLDLDVNISHNNIETNYDYDVSNYLIKMRDFERKFFSIGINLVFFSDGDLEMELLPPYLEDNDFINKAVSVPGKFNIGKWLRPIDLALVMKGNHTRLRAKKNDVFNYIRFNKPVKFVQFDYTQELSDIQKDILRSKMILGTKSPVLNYYYSLFKNSKYRHKILHLIKENILEE